MRIAQALRVKPGDVITLVGGGGKTTVMFRLAEDLVAAGLTVLSTMTTKIFVGQMARAPLGLLLGKEGALPEGLATKLAEHRHVLLGGSIGDDREKVEGVPPEVVDRLAAAGCADVIIVEGDGARRLPFKAPAEHEPVVPRSTTLLVPLVGLDVLGQPLDAEHVHRPQLITELAGARLSEPVTPHIIAAVLAHPRGGAKGLPEGARLVPLLNKADLNPQAGKEVAAMALSAPHVAELVIGAAETAEPVHEVWGRTAAVVLAAGEGSRFRDPERLGQLKQVLPWQGVPLVSHVARQALACRDIGQVIVTTGARADLVEGALRDYAQEVKRVHVGDWAEGQSRSVRVGLQAARENAHGSLSAAVFLLADQPDVTPALLAALIRRHRETLAPVVAPRYAGRRGNPVLFDRRTFAEFDSLNGDVGARGIIRRYEAEVAWVDWPTDEILRDIDTPEDYDGAQER